MRDKITKKFRGFAFITYQRAIDMEAVLKRNHTLQGYTMQIKKAISKDQSRKKVVEEKFRKLFIVGLPQDAKKYHIKEHFKKYGEIEDVRIIVDKMAKTSRGFGFVLFQQASTLNKVLAEEIQHKILGKTVSFIYFHKMWSFMCNSKID